MKIVRDALSLALVASGLVGSQILLSDRWLWSAEPSHAYGLIGFVLIDMMLAAAMLIRVGLATVGAAFVAVAQFTAMLADIAVGQPEGVQSIAFRNFLLSDASYLGLLFIQIAIFIIAVGAATVPLLHRHGHLTGYFHYRRH